MKNRILGVMFGLTLVSAGCEKTLPTAPSDWATGIIIYEHANYLGQAAFIDEDISNLKDYKGPCVESSGSGTSETTTNSWKNCVSSIRVAPGWKATLYVDTNFKGRSVEIAADASNLQLVAGDCDHGGFNDCIESVKISRQ